MLWWGEPWCRVFFQTQAGLFNCLFYLKSNNLRVYIFICPFIHFLHQPSHFAKFLSKNCTPSLSRLIIILLRKKKKKIHTCKPFNLPRLCETVLSHTETTHSRLDTHFVASCKRMNAHSLWEYIYKFCAHHLYRN